MQYDTRKEDSENDKHEEELNRKPAINSYKKYLHVKDNIEPMTIKTIVYMGSMFSTDVFAIKISINVLR